MKSNNFISESILELERDGEIQPISKKDFFTEYKARFGSESAIYTLINFSGDELSVALANYFEKAGLYFTCRYVLPFEDVLILFDGKDLDGVESSRVLAGVSLAVDLIPIAGKIYKLVKTGKIAGKVLTKEIVQQLLKKEAKDFVTDATKNFVGDVSIQFIINFVDALICGKDNPIWNAISNINFIDKAQLSLSSSISNNNKVLIEAIICAEKGCMAFKKAQKDKDASAIQDFMITCVFDVIIHLDMAVISKGIPKEKIKYFCDNWSTVMKNLKKYLKTHTKFVEPMTVIGNLFEQIYYHDK